MPIESEYLENCPDNYVMKLIIAHLTNNSITNNSITHFQ